MTETRVVTDCNITILYYNIGMRVESMKRLQTETKSDGFI